MNAVAVVTRLYAVQTSSLTESHSLGIYDSGLLSCYAESTGKKLQMFVRGAMTPTLGRRDRN